MALNAHKKSHKPAQPAKREDSLAIFFKTGALPAEQAAMLANAGFAIAPLAQLGAERPPQLPPPPPIGSSNPGAGSQQNGASEQLAKAAELANAGNASRAAASSAASDGKAPASDGKAPASESKAPALPTGLEQLLRQVTDYVDARS